MKRAFAVLLLLFALLCASACAQEDVDMEHYLLVGVDGWGLNEAGGARSDAIILASLDYGRNRLTFTSFARDSIVHPAHRKGMVKLNTLVRSAEGERVLIDYLCDTYGIEIGGYFVINFSGAVDVINAIGGIDIELSQAEVDYVNHHAGQYEKYPLSPGVCRIGGAQALYYMRCRSLDNDFGRQGRQGKVLRALMDELAEITPLRAMLLLDDVLGMYRTNLSSGQQLELALKALALRRAEVTTHSLPPEGGYRYGKDSQGASGLTFDLEDSRARLHEWLGIQEEQVKR